jgi:diguanylate cyclase
VKITTLLTKDDAVFTDTIDALDKAKRIFDHIADTFEEKNINPSPLNYYIWYSYIKGDNPRFRQEMDSILKDPYGYTDRMGKRLYDDYLTDDDSSSTEFDRAFRRLIDLMVQKMNSWSSKLETHTAELDRCTTELADPDLDPKKVKIITDTVLNAANTMKESSVAFQEEMNQSSEEVKILRQQLIEARSEAMLDELTEVGNRKMFNNTIEEFLMNSEEHSDSLCIILSDIDHFKKFNDTYGHLVGDSILRYFANLMKKTRSVDETICRYGGEEFIILLANSSLEKAAERAEQIRVSLEKAHLKRKDEDKPISTVTASFGIAVFNGTESAEELVSRADKALYQAKNNGRNQTVLETELKEV